MVIGSINDAQISVTLHNMNYYHKTKKVGSCKVTLNINIIKMKTKQLN